MKTLVQNLKEKMWIEIRGDVMIYSKVSYVSVSFLS